MKQDVRYMETYRAQVPKLRINNIAEDDYWPEECWPGIGESMMCGVPDEMKVVGQEI
jgi:hypothetical protein